MVDLNSLNPEQRRAVETTEGPVLILAGAGTGKTRVITYRLAHLIARGVPPGQILAVTFTNKAAREMKERVAQLVPRPRGAPGQPPPEAPTICTFHALGARLLRQYIDRLGYKPNFVIYSESERLSAVRRILAHFNVRGVTLEPAEVAAAISRLKNGFGGREDTLHELARRLLPRYESALRACNAVDFDDLLGLTLHLLRQDPEVLAQCRQRFRYIMVDEYQDTNAAQFEILRLLAAQHQNLCVVGDDDQSIYGWRGAEIANLLDMEKYFPRVKVIKLEQNYRSTSVILEAANAVITHNARRRPKKLWSRNGQGSRIVLHTFANEDEEARGIVEQIEINRKFKRIPWQHQAILFRTNHQARALETALRAARVRYHLVGGQSYFDRREIKDFLAYLRTFHHPHDDISLLRIANVPARGLSEATMERLLAASQERRCSVFAAMRHTDVQAALPGRTREAVRQFLHLVETHHHTLTQPAPPGFSLRRWAEHWLEQVGYWEEIRSSEKTPEEAENRLRILKDLVSTLDQEDYGGATPGERLNRFLEEVTLDTERDEDKEVEGDQVTLITLHSCKGLEFPHVFLVGLEEGLLPHTRSKEEGTVDEERRLFYVGITRARQTLTLSHCLARKKYGTLAPMHPSRFLLELPSHLVERAEERRKQPVSVEEGSRILAELKASLRSKA
ncbi:MAG: UvrD-helicase domain-containing protein [Verrucomicrobiae bacterium]|nr:UvrD-helicase domain-containing protein [Verrucomicrobiae bacterium]